MQSGTGRSKGLIMFIEHVPMVVLSLLSFAALMFAIHCFKDANKGGDFGQVYSWTYAVVALAVSIASGVMAAMLRK